LALNAIAREMLAGDRTGKNCCHDPIEMLRRSGVRSAGTTPSIRIVLLSCRTTSKPPSSRQLGGQPQKVIRHIANALGSIVNEKPLELEIAVGAVTAMIAHTSQLRSANRQG